MPLFRRSYLVMATAIEVPFWTSLNSFSYHLLFNSSINCMSKSSMLKAMITPSDSIAESSWKWRLFWPEVSMMFIFILFPFILKRKTSACMGRIFFLIFYCKNVGKVPWIVISLVEIVFQVKKCLSINLLMTKRLIKAVLPTPLLPIILMFRTVKGS